MSLRHCVIAAILWAFLLTQTTSSSARSHFPGNFDASGYVPDGRIINGTLATQNATKFQVSIRKRLGDSYYFGTGHLCGGSLIGPNVVLSAAHCFVDYDSTNGSFLPAEEFIAVMGNLDRFEQDNNTLVFSIDKIVLALDNFNLKTYEKDIAIAFLNDSVPVNHTTVEVIPYASKTAPDGTVCQVTGWGETEEGFLSDMLMTVDVPIINVDVCANESDFASGLIKEGMMCAGYLEEGERDACGGDSGGPLVCNHILNGIVSWGIGCAEPRLPGVYTNVEYWSEWIQNKTGIAPYNSTDDGHENGDAVALKTSSWLLAVIFMIVTLLTN